MAENAKKIFVFTKADLYAVLAILLSLTFQFSTYFIAKNLADNPHVVNGEIDNYIPFVKYFIVFYTVWYFMIVIVPFIISRKDRTLFHIYIWTYNIMFFAALITFIAYPTIVDIPEVPITDFWTYWANWIYARDYPPINAIPSGHTMACLAMIYSTILCNNLKKGPKTLIVIINVLTIISTVLVKQHALIDLFYAFIYTTIIFVAVWLVYKKVLKRN